MGAIRVALSSSRCQVGADSGSMRGGSGSTRGRVGGDPGSGSGVDSEATRGRFREAIRGSMCGRSEGASGAIRSYSGAIWVPPPVSARNPHWSQPRLGPMPKVFSASLGRWCAGVITGVSKDRILTVQYADGAGGVMTKGLPSSDMQLAEFGSNVTQPPPEFTVVPSTTRPGHARCHCSRRPNSARKSDSPVSSLEVGAVRGFASSYVCCAVPPAGAWRFNGAYFPLDTCATVPAGMDPKFRHSGRVGFRPRPCPNQTDFGRHRRASHRIWA